MDKTFVLLTILGIAALLCLARKRTYLVSFQGNSETERCFGQFMWDARRLTETETDKMRRFAVASARIELTNVVILNIVRLDR